MNTNYQKFLQLLDDENKDEAILFIHNLLDKGDDIVDVYETILIPSLRDYHCDSKQEEICIWKEHTRTSIIRTILESTYPYLIKARKKDRIDKFIVIACPQEEYHEIGALVSTNYFYLMGYEAKYIGANTPSAEIESAVSILKPDYLALSITNYYNLIQTKKLIEKLKTINPELKIILGGQAAMKHADEANIQYDYILNGYKDIEKFRGDDQ